jgi:hypothetical protein
VLRTAFTPWIHTKHKYLGHQHFYLYGILVSTYPADARGVNSPSLSSVSVSLSSWASLLHSWPNSTLFESVSLSGPLAPCKKEWMIRVGGRGGGRMN